MLMSGSDRFTNCMAVVSLTTATAILSNWWTRDVIDLAIGWRIFMFLFVLILINILGAKVYVSSLLQCRICDYLPKELS
jgi:amino acid permease